MGEVTGCPVMRKRRGLASGVLGLTIGFLLGFLFFNYRINYLTPNNNNNNNNNQYSNITSQLWNSSPDQETAQLFQTSQGSTSSDSHVNSSRSSLVFVGVMTAQKYLDSRAKAVYKTWGKELPGKVAFFSSESSVIPKNCPDLPLVALPTVDDSYPPQKKSFLMLQYMWNNFGDKYEWFLRADDDVYIRTDKLENLLRSVDSRRPMYIGQAGRGNSEEFGLLSLEYDENFCMGGPGVIMSRETLGKIVPHIKRCLKNLYTTHEDVELGRCVRKYAGIPCTWSYEMQAILYHNSSGDQAFTGNLKKKEVHRAITMHPVKNSQHMYRLHNYMRGLKIQDLQQQRVMLHRDVYTMAEQFSIDPVQLRDHKLAEGVSLFPGDSIDVGDTSVLGVPASLRAFKPQSSREVISWDFLARSEYSLGDSNPRRRIHSDVKEGLEDITREVMASINACSRQRGRNVEEKSMLYGYRRVDSFGADTILDLLLSYKKYRGKKMTLPVRRHVYLHQHFTGIEVRQVYDQAHQDSSVSDFSNLLGFTGLIDKRPPGKLVKFILPLSGRFHVFERFLANYERVCLIPRQNAELLVILYPHRSEKNSTEQTINLIKSVKLKYPKSVIRIVEKQEKFSRAKALDEGVSRSKDDELLFFIDVDIAFTEEALTRIRLNTIVNRRVYFPIVFSQFDSKLTRNDDNFLINELTGYWRQFGFGIVSIYKRDYASVGGLNVSIEGWGKEDVDFYEKTVKSELSVFRAPDLSLVHVYHEVDCDDKLSESQLAMCRGTRADTFANVQVLANMIYDNPEYLKFAKSRRKRNKGV